jgi:hypothetical protein
VRGDGLVDGMGMRDAQMGLRGHVWALGLIEEL